MHSEWNSFICRGLAVDFKIKTVTGDEEGHYIMIKGSIQEDITIVNIYESNVRAPKHMKQILTDIKGKLTVTQ